MLVGFTLYMCEMATLDFLSFKSEEKESEGEREYSSKFFMAY